MRTRPAASSVAALVSLALCVCANGGAAAAGRTQVAGREGVLTLTSKAPTGQRGHWLVAFQEEISQEAGASRVEGRSLKGAADVDCGALRFQVAKLDVFEGPNFTGALLLDVGRRNEWRSPESGTTLDRVLIATCGRTKVEAEGRVAGVVPSDVDPPASALPAKVGPVWRSGSAPAKESLSFSRFMRTGRSSRSAVQPQAPSAPAAPAVVAAVAETAAPRIAPSPPRVVPPAGGGAFYAQLAAVASQDAARQAWERLERAAPGVLNDRLRRLTTATVNGRRVYRVSAGGFGTRAEAETVCKALARLSAQCFVRPGDTA